MRRTLILAGALGALGGPALAEHGAWDLRGAQVWSNICLSQETGDARGLRVFVRAQGVTPRIIVQMAEGAPLPPLATRAAQVDAKGLSFTVAATGEVFTGRVVGDVLVLKTRRLGETPLRLRRRSEASGFPVCVGDDGRS
ncbi:hypothetical protein [Phenylobacterium sp.]|uniref:hypothetical protein n=1 Tax=Phenylobacterium sp. TaxID=1871053 RepID=UPI003BAC8310